MSRRSVRTVGSPVLRTRCARGHAPKSPIPRTPTLGLSEFRPCQPVRRVAPLDADAAAGSQRNIPLAATLGVSSRSVLTVGCPVLRTQCARGHARKLTIPRTPTLGLSELRPCQPVRRVAPVDADAARRLTAAQHAPRRRSACSAGRCSPWVPPCSERSALAGTAATHMP